MRCPECDRALTAKARVCECGWALKTAVRKSPRHGLCEFSDHGVLCQAFGTISLHTAPGGPWYCANHAFHVGGRSTTPRRAAPTGEEIIQQEIDRRGYRQLPGESDSVWRERLYAERRRLGVLLNAKISRKPVQDPSESFRSWAP